ncbi:ABC transporter ATP-binding protein [Bradyrhizobium mercantei]|uniref:ABC transporter ATP-binding protein n=1 Tax=Bradyrhizobium mercantei TaxID=1904807 RepID=UPI0009F8D75A|nr:ABC transporter ATP-binding protein [Bradyrhizobium mercantei]
MTAPLTLDSANTTRSAPVEAPANADGVHTPLGTEPALFELRQATLTLAGRPILEKIDFVVRRKEFVSVVGSSGCGKTSLLRLMAGLARQTAGEVLYDGKPITRSHQDVAIVFQDYGKALLPWRTVTGNVALALEAMRVPKSEYRDRIGCVLELVGLAQHADKYPGQLSGGMQQRLQIARALAQEPKAILMDEPFGALDAMTRQSLQDEILTIVARTGATVFFVTHDLEEAIYLGDRVIVLRPNPGRIVRTFDVNLSRPRDQLRSREDGEFTRLRHELHTLFKELH